MKRIRNEVGQWMLRRVKLTPEKDNYLSLWLIVSLFCATTGLAVIYAIGNPLGTTLFSHVSNIALLIAINTILFPIATLTLGLLFSLIYLPLPRLLLGSFIYTAFSSVFILHVESSGALFSYIIGIGYSVIALLVGLFLIILNHKKISRNVKLIALGAALAVISIYLFVVKVDYQNPAIPVLGEYSEGITSENPGEPGTSDYHFLTYGSGQDRQREEYGKAVDQVTATVDSSDFITKWGDKREKFWGFGPSELPINGRAWIPEGEGKFPVFLMVHGNHTMEYLSTAGYDYLGELLASKGIIAISVDEDFINYSNRLGIPNDNYTLRAWMILQHLAQLQVMNEDVDTIFYDKIDFDNVALMGHSRGGQAALMAADYETFFEDEELRQMMEKIDIKGVVAIAPTDKKIDKKEPQLHNISYLLLHGARDADVSNYRGDNQFYRSTFDPGDKGFKTTLYIGDANHTQFNSDWGSMDLSLPRGLFLNRKQTMSGEEQRQIAKAYLAAFLDRIFYDNRDYDKLFQDYRYGAEWLPDSEYVSKYEDAAYKPITQFKRNKVELIDVAGFEAFGVITPKGRRGQKHLVAALDLEWEKAATYTVNLEKGDLKTRAKTLADQLVLRMANNDNQVEEGHVPEIEVELKTTDGISVTLPLEKFMPFPSVINTDYTHFGLFDNFFREGKYDMSWEPIFQTFELPITTFEQENADFVRENINQLTLHFKGNGGKILIEEIGVR